MTLKIINNVFVEIRDAKTKEVIGTRETHNLITTAGLKWVRDLIAGTDTRPNNIELGTGLTAETVSDTTLETRVYTAPIDRRVPSLSPPTIAHKMFLGGDDANGNTLSEIGLVRGPLLIARALLDPVIVKTDLVELTITHEISVA